MSIKPRIVELLASVVIATMISHVVISNAVISNAMAQSDIKGPLNPPSGQPVVRNGASVLHATNTALSNSHQSGDVVLSDRVRPVAGSFEDRFWRYLVRAKYQNWSPLPRQTAGFSIGGTPHGAFVKTYVNRTASSNPKDFPTKSVIISENYSRDKLTLESLTVLYVGKKERFWVKYLTDGSIARAPAALGGQKLSGNVKSCVKCHVGASGDDYVFGN